MIIDLNVFVHDPEKALSQCWQPPREPEARGSRSRPTSSTNAFQALLIIHLETIS